MFRNIKNSLTKDTFEYRRLAKKTEEMQRAVDRAAIVNVRPVDDLEEEEDSQFSETLTPFMRGKIRYKQLIKKDNRPQIEEEFTARGVHFEHSSNWTNLITLLKADEGDQTFFMPAIDYDRFVIKELN